MNASGTLEVGSSVFYRDQRYWVETIGQRFIRIADTPIRPEAPAPLARNSFYVPAPMVEAAPTTRNKYGRQPSKKVVERRERQKVEGTKDNGDEVAVLLRACADLDGVYKAAAKYLRVPEKELRVKYGHLNPGQQRMTAGNLLRSAHKKGLIKIG